MTGATPPRIGEPDMFGFVAAPAEALAKRFGAPPFSVLSARDGPWQERKRKWLALGIQSELGRGQQRLEMAHPATTANIDFYAQKRALEAELGGGGAVNGRSAPLVGGEGGIARRPGGQCGEASQ